VFGSKGVLIAETALIMRPSEFWQTAASAEKESQIASLKLIVKDFCWGGRGATNAKFWNR
jgi:hypothetical protein